MTAMPVRSRPAVFAAFAGGVCLCALLSLPAQATAETFKLKLNPSVSTQFKALENDDLGTATDNQLHSYTVAPRLRAQLDISDKVQAVVDVRAVTSDGSTPGEDETGESSSTNDYLEARQYYLKLNGGTAGIDNVNVQIGRQRIREDRSLWWNRDIEAARVNYDSTLIKGFVGVAQALSSNRTSDDFFEASKDRLRFFGEGSWQYKPGQFIEARALYENDHSGTGAVGNTILTDDRDDEDFKLGWYGARARGDAAPASGHVRKLAYRLDALVVGGTEDLVTTAAAGTDNRTITAVTNRDVFGWALDAGADLALDAPLNPTITLGYAFGSGDSDPGDNTDHEFRQSGLHGNSSLPGLASGSVYHYGEVLRPELANLHIVTLGAGIPVGENSDLSLFYHYYRLAQDATSLRSSTVRAALNGTDKDIGQELDLIFNSRLSDALGLELDPLEQIKLRASAGVFHAGGAYSVAEDENAARLFTELLFGF